MQTNITTQVTAAIAATALLCLVGFGYISYRTAVNSAGHDEEVLSLLAEHLSREMMLPGIGKPTIEQMRKAMERIPDQAYTGLLLDRAGQVVVHNGGPLPERVVGLPYLKFLTREPVSGRDVIGGELYVWSARPIDNSQYTFVVLYRISTGIHASFFQALRIPLSLATGSIILISWLAAVIINARHRRIELLRRQLKEQLMFDPVTGIARETLLNDRLQRSLSSARRSGQALTTLLISLSHLKGVASQLVSEAGNDLLLNFRDMLLLSLRDSDSLAFLDSETLAVILPDTDGAQTRNVARKLLECFSSPVRTGEEKFFIQIHMGAAVFPAHGSSAGELLDNARSALRVSRQASNEFTLYEKNLDSFHPEQLSYINNLRRGINNNELYLLLQPKIDLRTSTITGAEVLIRWRDNNGAEKMPDEFIPIAEQSGLIGSLTQWLVQQTIQTCINLQLQGISLPLAINISTYCLHDPSFEPMIIKQLDQADLDYCNITLEITESAMMESQARAMDLLGRLTARGINVAIDDFGTGYSSLTYLRKLPISELKIDKSFVTRMLSDHNDLSIVRSTIGLAHDLGMNVVAEGIEDSATLDVLIQNGCDIGQGYYFSPALSVDEMVRWYRENTSSFHDLKS